MAKDKRPEAYAAIQAQVGKRMLWVRLLVEPNRAEVARWLRVDTSTLAKIEEGDRAPSIFTVMAYARHFRVSHDFLLAARLGPPTDPEIERLLIAHHPELVLGPSDRDTPTPSTAPPIDKPRKPKRQSARRRR
jgi:DNA-binding XRE family transcriptional regulator